MSLNVVMLGPPGAGKGTQAELLARALGIPKISTGDILREAVTAGTEIGRLVKETMDAGRLVSDEMMIAVVRERLARPDTSCGFVLDGFPRTVRQAEALEAMMFGRATLTVLHLVVPEDVLVHRLTGRRICGACGQNASPGAGAGEGERCGNCGGALVRRSDDDEAVVRARLRVYGEQTQPLIRHYQGRETFHEIDGNRAPGTVAAALRMAVESDASVGIRPMKPTS